MLRFVWSLSLLLSVISLVVMTVLIVRRVRVQRRTAVDAAGRQRLLKSLIGFTHDRDQETLKQALFSVPARVALATSFEFLSLLRGEEHDQVIATLAKCGLAVEAEAQLATKNEALRIHAAEMLAALRSENAIPKLLATLDGDRSREVRIAAAIALCDLGSLPPLETTLRKIGVAGQRSKRLVDLFRRLPAARSDELKTHAASTEATPSVKAAIIDALAQTGDLRLADFFGHSVEDTSPEVAAAAVRALGRTGHANVGTILARAMASHDWGVRQAAAVAAGQIGAADLVAPLVDLLNDENWTVRYSAANALRSSPLAERTLREIAAGQSSRSQRTASLTLSEGPIA
jgi:HEAT repeat protein